MASRMLRTHGSDEGSSSPTAGVFLSLSGVERAPGVLSNSTGHHFSAHHVTLRSVCFQTSHLLGEVYCVISPFLSKGQLRHRLVIVSKQSRDLKPQYNLTSRRSFKKTHNNYFCLCWVLITAQGLSLVAESRGYSLVAVRGLLTAVASWGAVAQELWRRGLLVPWHAVRCSQRDQTRGPCIGRQILINETTRKAPKARLLTLLATLLTS